jgi:hypothetical protein
VEGGDFFYACAAGGRRFIFCVLLRADFIYLAVVHVFYIILKEHDLSTEF